MPSKKSKPETLEQKVLDNLDANRRDFLKKVVISGSGAVTIVKASAAAADTGSIPAIISLLLDDEDNRPTTLEFGLANGIDQDQVISVPTGANFADIEVRGAGGGGSPSIVNASDTIVPGGNGGAGGLARGVFRLADLDTSSLVARVGSGGHSGGNNNNLGEAFEGGGPGQFGGGRGGGVATDLKINSNQINSGGLPGSGGGGYAGVFSNGNAVILAGGGGGAGGGNFAESVLSSGGAGGIGGPFDNSENQRSGEDGAPLQDFGRARGGNRQSVSENAPGDGTNFFNESQGGTGARGTAALNGAAGDELGAGTGGSNFSETSIGGAGGGGGGSLFSAGEFNGHGGGGGAGRFSLSGGGGAGGSNNIDRAIALTDSVQDIAGGGGAGGAGGVGGETSEVAIADRIGESGAPGQVIITFYGDDPTV